MIHLSACFTDNQQLLEFFVTDLVMCVLEIICTQV